MMGRRPFRGLAVAGVVVAVDLLTKRLAEDELREPVRVLPGLELDLGFNSGVAFGALNGLPTAALVSGLSLLIGALIVGAWRGWFAPPWPAAGLLLGGALGNLIDRSADGRVTDFIDPARWPPFNVADVAITLGVMVLVVASLRDERRAEKSAVSA